MIEKNFFKIGVLTMHCVPNYGAVLQAYATVAFFRRVSNEYFDGRFKVEIVDYQPTEKKKKYSFKILISDSLKSVYSLLRNIHNFSYNSFKLSKNLHVMFYDFLQSKDCLSCELSRSELFKLKDKYDALIVGSDQVWNPYGMKNDYSYLLDFFSNVNRYSFSSSFGISKFPKEYEIVYRTLLSEFNHVSVREKTGLEIYEKLTGRKDGIVLLDPTLMLSVKDYLILEDDISCYSKSRNYTLVYLAMHSQNLVKYAKEHTKNGTDVIILGMPDVVVKMNDCECKIVKAASIGVFLSLFNHAEQVYTNSFHGIAFSLIYNKNVWIEWNNVYSRSNSRLENIVRKFGLNKRIISDVCDDSNIDFEMIKKQIDFERRNAVKFVKQIMQELDVSKGG